MLMLINWLVNRLSTFSDGTIIRIMSTRLRSLGLKSLVQVGEGNIVIAENSDLCYANTVNWTALRIGDKSGRTIISENRKSDLCGQCRRCNLRSNKEYAGKKHGF